MNKFSSIENFKPLSDQDRKEYWFDRWGVLPSDGELVQFKLHQEAAQKRNRFCVHCCSGQVKRKEVVYAPD